MKKRSHKTYVKLVLRGVGKSLNRFFSILLIVALGAGFLAGLLAATPDMQETADEFFDSHGFYDINVKGTYGITEGDLAAIRLDGAVEEAEGAYVSDRMIVLDTGENFAARIYGMERLSERLTLVSGRLPEHPGECVIEEPSAYVNSFDGVKHVDIVPVETDDDEEPEDVLDTFTAERLEIVGTVKSAYFISVESENTSIGSGKIGAAVFTLPGAFSLDVYTDAFIRLSGAEEMNTFEEEYFDYAEETAERLEDISGGRCDVRHTEVVDEANEALADARSEYEEARLDAEQKLADAQQEIDDGNAELADAELELADAEDKLDKSKRTVNSASRQLNEYEAGLDEQEAQLNAGKSDVDAAKAAQAAGYPLPAQTLALIEQYDLGMAQLGAARAELEAQRAELSRARKRIADAETELADAETELADAKIKLADAQIEYDDAAAEAETELADAEKKLDDAAEDISELKAPEWFVFDRRANMGFHSYNSNIRKIASISRVFPAVFFLVAALVALTTMTRMVDEERLQIGALKSLGYSDAAVLLYYLIYSAIASVCGCAAGLTVGFSVLPRVISNAYTMMYSLPTTETPFRPEIAAIVAPLMIVCIMISTFIACRGTMRERPAYLLLPRAPKEGKRIWLEHIGFIWRPMRFIHKVTARNLFRYKKRLCMTVIGIAGCSALLVTGFGLRNSISDIVGKQYDELYRFDLTLNLRDEEDARTDRRLMNVLGDESLVEEYAFIHSGGVKLSRAGSSASEEATLYVPETAGELYDMITFRERKGGAPVEFAQGSVVLGEKLSEVLGVGVGDRIALETDDGETAEFTVSGITENYILAYVYMAPDVYEAAFGTEYEHRLVMVRRGAECTLTDDELSERFLRSEQVSYVQTGSGLRNSFESSLSKIDYIVWVLIGCAGALAVIVLYNLTNINICERRKELATIKVLGFYDREVASYIFRETNMLSAIGGILGLAIGVVLHAFVASTAEVDAVMFGRDIYFSSFAMSAGMTLLFTLTVNLIMTPQLKAIDMVESMKAND